MKAYTLDNNIRFDMGLILEKVDGLTRDVDHEKTAIWICMTRPIDVAGLL